MADLGAIEAELTAPGGLFEVRREQVLGEEMDVLAGRARSLRELLEASARFGDAEYIVQEERRIGYAENLRVVASVAAALQHRFGVGKGDRVAILAANCPEWIQAFWATVSLGAIVVGLNGWWAGDEILFGLADSEPKLLIGDRRRLERLGDADPGVPVVEIESAFAELAGHDADAALPSVAIDEDDPACILYTSGTTGRPKGAVNTHRSIIAMVGLSFFHGVRMLSMAAADGLLDPAEPQRPNCGLCNTPLFHVSGLFTGAISALAAGGKTVWMSGRFDPVRVMETIEREKVMSWSPMSTMAYRVAHHPDLSRYDLSSVRAIGSGGGPLSHELQERICEVFPAVRATLGLGYGLTECAALATIAFGEDLLSHPGSTGQPLPTVEIEIRDESGRALADGEEGEVFIRSPLVMPGYWRRPEETAAVIGPGRWLRSGDIGRMEDGRLYIESRKRDLILRGGENVYPVEIEHRLEAHPDIDEAAVVGVDHPELGQEVKAVVVAAAGAAVRSEDLAAWVGETLAHFKVPSKWEFRSEPLPRNAAGKVMKHVLVGAAANPFVADS